MTSAGTPALRWLEGRAAGPPALAARIADAVAAAEAAADASDDDVPAVLASAARDRLRAVLAAASPRDRSTALDLLAADALLTLACEAAVERGPAALEALAARIGPGALAELLPPDPA